MMALDNGVSSPGGKAGSDASMVSCTSSEDGHEVDSADVQGGGAGALVGRKRSSSKLNPPKEEDRTLPLKKLFENLSELTDLGLGRMDDLAGGPLSNGSSSSVYAGVPFATAPKAASVAGDLPHMDLQVQVGHPGLGSSFRVGSAAAVTSAPGSKPGSMSQSQAAATRGLLQQQARGGGVAGASAARASPMRRAESPLSSPLPSPAPLGRHPWGSSSSVHNGNAFSNRAMLLHNLSQVVAHAHAACLIAVQPGGARMQLHRRALVVLQACPACVSAVRNRRLAPCAAGRAGLSCL
jgi:hypothetical protein